MDITPAERSYFGSLSSVSTQREPCSRMHWETADRRLPSIPAMSCSDDGEHPPRVHSRTSQRRRLPADDLGAHRHLDTPFTVSAGTQASAHNYLRLFHTHASTLRIFCFTEATIWRGTEGFGLGWEGFSDEEANRAVGFGRDALRGDKSRSTQEGEQGFAVRACLDPRRGHGQGGSCCGFTWHA